MPKAPTDADYSSFRQRYLSLQHTMENGIGGLRSRLRGMLAGRNPEMTRLAMVDAIMERSLSVRERALMIPTLLGAHFERLRKAEQSAQEEAEAAEMPPPANRRLAGHVSQGHAQRVAGRTGYSFSTGGRGLLAALRTR